MGAQTNLFQDLWTGWKGFVGEIVGIKTTQTSQVRKPKNMVNLKRDATLLKRPVRKRTKQGIKAEYTSEFLKRQKKTEVIFNTPADEDEKMGEVPASEVMSARVDPKKPFLLDKEFLETPDQRKVRIEKKKIRALQKKLQPTFISPIRRHLLFVNPGTQKMKEAHLAFRKGLEMPTWTRHLMPALTFDKDRLYFENKPMLNEDEKRMLVKKEYFNPKGFSTIRPIHDKFREEYANLTRKDVTKMLRSFETYQLNFGRRVPPKVLSRMSMKKPGVILADMFFPSKNLGWRSDLGGCVTMMDAWSRFVRCYSVERKNKKTVKKAMQRFMREFASLGHLPRIILCDKGTDLAPAKEVIEPYRTKPGNLVLHSTTGKPVNLVEQTQSQIQRRMAVFRTSGITDDPGVILEDISDSINNQKRPDRGNLSPLELLKLNKQEIQHINDLHTDRVSVPDLKGLRPLFKGSHVRVLEMTMKEQLQNKTKGFAPKWSLGIFVVRKKQALQGNPSHFRYFLNDVQESYFRHELLWVPKSTDTEIIDRYVVHQEKTIMEEEDEYVPSDDDYDTD
jgi:hypothetical protein